jgi:hypothetical protein
MYILLSGAIGLKNKPPVSGAVQLRNNDIIISCLRILRTITPIINIKANKERVVMILPGREYDLSALLLCYISSAWIY